MTVESLITAAKGYAKTAVDAAVKALDDANTSIGMIGYSTPNPQTVDMPTDPTKPATLTPPALPDVPMDLPLDPTAAPEPESITPIELGVLPQLKDEPLPFIFPDAPVPLEGFKEPTPAIVTEFQFPPVPPELLNPFAEAPTITAHAAPAAPEVLLPVFDATAPLNDTAAPTDLAAQFDESYASASITAITVIDAQVDMMMQKHNPRYKEQMGRIEDQLVRYLDGGTGLNTEVEDAIYSRARERNDLDAARAREVGYAEAASRGFTLPTGALMAGIARSRQEAANATLKANSDIVVMRAEMEQKNLQFAVTTSLGLRTVMLQASLSYHQNLISINGQALEYAKSILGVIVETYNITVKAFASKLDAYKAEAAVYEVRLKSAMAGIELYQAELRALEVLTDVDKVRTDVYRARIDTLRVVSDVYKARIDAVLGEASLEKLKLDLFQMQVQAHTAEVQAKNAEWQGYSAAIAGQAAKASIFKMQVDKYSSEVQGYKAGIEAQAEVARAQAANNQANAAQYAATVSSFTAVVQAKGEKARTQLENQRQEIIAFQAEAQAAIANAQVELEHYKAVSTVKIANAEMNLRGQIEGGNNQTAYGQTVANLAVSAAQVQAGMANAAMSGMSSLAVQSANE